MSKITENQIKFIATTYPSSIGDNTQFLICFLEHTCKHRNIPPSWDNIKAVMREYKPETIMRKRREFMEATPEQEAINQKVKQEYPNGVPIDEILNIL